MTARFEASKAKYAAMSATERRRHEASLWLELEDADPPTHASAFASGDALGTLCETDDARAFGAVVCGDVADDGCDVGCETLALALSAWRLTGTLAGVVGILATVRPGEPWAAWVTAAVHGWLELRPRVVAMRTRVLAVMLAEAATRRASAARDVLVLAVARAEEANAETVRLGELVRRCCRG